MMPPDHGDDDRELDRLIHSLRESFIRWNDCSFDFEAGLADVAARTMRSQAVQGRPTGSAADLVGDRLAEACQHVDEFVALLGEALLATEPDALVGGHIQRAAEVMLRVRDQLAAGSLEEATARAAFTAAWASVEQADLISQVEAGLQLGYMASSQMHEMAKQQADSRGHLAHALSQLEGEIVTVLAASGRGQHPPSGPPAARRRRNEPPPGRGHAEDGA